MIPVIIAAILALQPATTTERAATLAAIFDDAGQETELDPLLLVSVARHESALSPAVERGHRRSSAGAIGLMQVLPWGAAMTLRPDGCGRELVGAQCQIVTGARWLARVDELCEGSTWVSVAAYNLPRCPSEGAAREDRNARAINRYYARAGGIAW